MGLEDGDSYRKTEPTSRARLGDSHLEGAFKMMPTRPVPFVTARLSALFS